MGSGVARTNLLLHFEGLTMDYETARPLIKSGDLIALSHYKWASWYDLQVQIVRFSTQSEYSHVGMAWVIGGRVFLVESVTPVIRMVPLSMMAKDGFYWAPLGKDISDPELEFALSKIGNGRYSKLEAVLAQVTGIQIGADDLWECAEFIIAARRLSGVDLGDKATPSAVVRAAQDLGAAVAFVK